MNTSSLLIEIFTEELPYSAIKKEFENVLTKFEAILKKYRLDSANLELDSALDSANCAKNAESNIDSALDSANANFFYTPRRMIIFIRNLPNKQNDELQEFFGPPLNIACLLYTSPSPRD